MSNFESVVEQVRPLDNAIYMNPALATNEEGESSWHSASFTLINTEPFPLAIYSRFEELKVIFIFILLYEVGCLILSWWHPSVRKRSSIRRETST